MSDIDHVCFCQFSDMHRKHHTQQQRHHNAMPNHRHIRLCQCTHMHGKHDTQWQWSDHAMQDRSHVCLCPCVVLYDNNHTGRQWQYNAMPVHGLEHPDHHRFVHGAGAVNDITLHGSDRNTMHAHDAGARWLDQRRYLHDIEHN